MNWLSRVGFRIRDLFQKDRLEAEMNEEMRLHLDLQMRRNLDAGMSLHEAQTAAQRQFGNLASIQEQVRDERGWVGVEQCLQDLRFAARRLLKSPGFTVIAILTLALGIGLNTSMFSFVNTLLLRPLPFPDAAQLVKLYRTTSQNQYGAFSPADYLDLRSDEAGFGRFAGYAISTMTLADTTRPVQWLRVSADLFDVLGVRPELGRTFRPEEEINGNHRVAIISYGLWQDRFGGAHDIIGQTARGNGETYEIIGVLPASATDHRLFGQDGLFSPLSLSDEIRGVRSTHWINILGRRAHEVSAAQGDVFLATFCARLAADFPVENAESGWRAVDLPLAITGPTGKILVFMLLGLSGCVLLIACSNLANFLLARTIERTRELAVRAALGASRLQLIRPLAFESLVLATAGGGGALVVAVWTNNWLRSVIANGGGPAFDFSLDWRVLSFALGVSALTLLFFGIAPALFTMRVNTNATLKSGGRGATTTRGHQQFRSVLLVGQFAFAAILLAGAGFFVRGSVNLLKQHHGWESDHVVQALIVLPTDKYSDGAKISAFHRQLLERVEHLPGVESASFSYGLPYLGLRDSVQYLVEGRDLPSKGQELGARANGITASYFKVTGTRLVAGRYFSDTDTVGSPMVGIINETMARVLFPGENPIGRRLRRVGAESHERIEIVGVVADVLSADVEQAPADFQVYHPMMQEPRHGSMLAVRTTGEPGSAIESIRTAISALDADLPVRDLMTVNRNIESVTSQMYLCQQLLTCFALLGLFLATIGIYGMIARLVVQRTNEIGIRMALGAQVHDVIGLFLGSGVRIAMLGAVIGLLGAFGLSRLVASMLPGMQTDDGLVVAAATTLLVAVALVACWLPARRAAKVDPVVALRSE